MTIPTSVWRMKNTTYGFLHLLILLKLTSRQIARISIEKLIRRHGSRYNMSSEITPSFYE
jgi:hypothetical protein